MAAALTSACERSGCLHFRQCAALKRQITAADFAAQKAFFTRAQQSKKRATRTSGAARARVNARVSNLHALHVARDHTMHDDGRERART